ncbi:TIGR03118 family protein [Paraburkholderia sp. NMBU_R16]|uniref:TIGR03118 family protein n=1 Tax=Paraburkholderia sp. NMBU_R16 TaxID=2698676 RepID=UPI0015659430|nr:TIGR03118 family protein [Paraburkholderia sp. NMBU_R16]NRO99462.1 TIGR03118 family protein [Paraburkholderia sp. NMBU_R16]
MNKRSWIVPSILMLATAGLLSACGGGDSSSPASQSPFTSTILVSDGSVTSAHTDTNLQNGWGVAFNPTGTFWVSDNGAHKSSLYDGNGVVQSLVVTIPDGSRGPAGPTGIIFNSTSDFAITAGGGVTNKAVFMWATDAGTIAAWSPKVLPTQAVTAFDDGAGGAIYKGLTAATVNGQNLIFAADFHNGKIDVLNGSFQKVQLSGQFHDPNLPAGFAPFGIQAIGNNIFVTYAKQNATASAQVVGSGQGVLDEFDTSGNFIRQIAAVGGPLNAPWGMALAPTNFGPLSNDLLVGNFGDGTIEAFDVNTGNDLGKLTRNDGSVFTQPGLWGISFGNDVDNQPKNTLFFAAGPSKTTGVFGRIDLLAN